MGKQWKQWQTLYFGASKITTDGDCNLEIKRRLLLGRKTMTNLDSILKTRNYFVDKSLSSQSYGFSSGHVWMWELDYKETWALKNWCFWTWCWRRLLRVHWTARRYTQSILKEISPEYSLEGLMAEAETPILWPPDAKNWLIGKDPDAGKDWGQEEKGTTEGEMAGWHHWLNGHEFEETPGVRDGQGGLVCCSPWGRKESDMTEQLNWTEPNSFNEYFSKLNILLEGIYILTILITFQSSNH